jgi:hypothetical protein
VFPDTARGPERFSAEPEAFVKFNVVTVLDPALKFPVRTRVVPEAPVKVAVWRLVLPDTARTPERLSVVPEEFVKLRDVTVDDPAEKFPVKDSVVPEASVYVTVWRPVVPVTFRFPVIVKFPVDVPPLNWMSLVVTFPAFVTVWRLGVVPVGQFVPFARQTLFPPTVRLETASLDPVAFVKLNSETVPEVERRVVKLAEDEMRFVLWRLVAKRLVPVASVKLRVVTVEEPALKLPVSASVVPEAFV